MFIGNEDQNFISMIQCMTSPFLQSVSSLHTTEFETSLFVSQVGRMEEKYANLIEDQS